jgi:hypothetical protein
VRAEVERAVEDDVADAERREQAGDERAADGRDAAEVGERQQRE